MQDGVAFCFSGAAVAVIWVLWMERNIRMFFFFVKTQKCRGRGLEEFGREQVLVSFMGSSWWNLKTTLFPGKG